MRSVYKVYQQGSLLKQGTVLETVGRAAYENECQQLQVVKEAKNKRRLAMRLTEGAGSSPKSTASVVHTDKE